MPDPQHKLVKVDDSIIKFPGDMPDADVAAVIKKFTSSPDYKKQTHTKNQMPSGIATEESEHKRLTGNVPTVTPDWNTVRRAVYKATEPTLQNPNTKPVDNSVKANVDAAWNAGANAANVGGNIAKRAGRVIFGAVDMAPQMFSILSKLGSPDDKVSQQAETDLLNFHPGAQIADRLKEAVHDWRKSKSLAAENALGDVLGFFLLDKAGKVLPEERIKQLNAEGVVLPPEAKPKAPASMPGQPPTIEGTFERATPKQVVPVEAAAKQTRNTPPNLEDVKAAAEKLKLPETNPPAAPPSLADIKAKAEAVKASKPEIAPKPAPQPVATQPVAAPPKVETPAPQPSTAVPPEPPKAEAPPAPKEEPKTTKYKYGNTQADIPQDSDAGKALATARTQIDKNDLMPSTNTTDGSGLEENAHITVRYGIDGEDTAGIKAYLEKQAPFEATLGKTTAFPPSEHSDGGAPIVVNIESPELHRMEKEIDEHGNFVDRSFPEYKPHVTLGYVKPEAAQKYVGMNGMEGKKFTVNSVSISNKDGSIEEVPLKGTQTLENADLKQVYKAPPASDIQLADAWRRLGDVKNQLAQLPRPYDPKPDATPEQIEKWKADYKSWAEKAEPWLQQYTQATQQIEDLKNRGIGEIRLLPDKSRILYLNRAGLNTLYTGMAGEARPGYTLSGVSLDPHTVKSIIGNLMILKPPLHEELTDLMLRGMDKKGVVIAAIPRKGDSIREAVSTLREELNHGWQNTVADQMGNHLPKEKFAELNEVIPEGMKSHLRINYPEITDDGSELMNRRRVREASAKMLSEAPQKLGITEDEAAAYLFQYFTALEEQHGEKALDKLLHITVLAKEIKDDYFRAIDRDTGKQAGGRGVGSLQDEGPRGAPGTDAQAGRGVPEGEGAAAKQVKVKDPEGYIHIFPDEKSASAFREAAGIK
jgi:2'-5' RNA ligase